ncbi:OPT/YSL family transporter [Phyllobacterium myrsinacearum]|uniref:Putative oligopeptide transporter (OPT) family protein n=1 Tax=Phyllobacterium myrsinacearum TaxID=28101 RepID=A0A839ESE5_9HYPH|nr:OPT/YSL family transporter [Phyllobacterium myrsinacearum]MBA8881025.1 putative oligopeptide transporter (OPT) family protein [Phyllobacterium myrsinacearum]
MKEDLNPVPQRHPSLFEPATLVLIAVLCVFGSIIGMQLLVSLGVTANTSLIGAMAAMALARIPVSIFMRYRSIHVQNLAQSAISSATFGASNSLLLPIGIPFVLGRPDLVLPMFVGAFMAMLLDAYMLYRLFDSKLFPAVGAWPPGVAAAEAIKAGDQGGRKAVLMGIGFVVGLIGAFFKIPMSAFGVAFIGNIWALSLFGVGLLLRAYSPQLFGSPMFADIIPKGDLMAAYIPHGFMIGAGIVALFQVAQQMLKRDGDDHNPQRAAGTTNVEVKRALRLGTVLYLVIASLIALIGGLMNEMSMGMLLLFILYAAFAAYVHELIVGLAAMHSGWFPAFAVALITLIIGTLIGFPKSALALLVGFSAATGPAFADMGYDLKAGYILRGNGADPAFEREGRRQQLFAAMFAFVIAGIVVLFSYQSYFDQNLVAPVNKVYAATIEAGVAPGVIWSLAIWAIPGALLQFIGGTKRQIGVLFATGLLINFAAAGWAVLAGILIRLIWERLRGANSDGDMEVFAAGTIAGDSIFSFFDSTIKSLRR